MTSHYAPDQNIVVRYCVQLRGGMLVRDGYANRRRYEKKLDAEIPAGTALAVAESKLKAQGFSVSHVASMSVPCTQPVESLDAEMTEDGIVNTTWSVRIFARRDAVVRIEVQQWLTGP